MRIGIDFGTTNSAVAVVEDGEARIVELFDGEPLQRTVIHCDPRGVLRFGNEGFRTYVASDLDGRLMRSLKSFLSQDVPNTSLGGRRYAFTELVTLYLRFLVRRAEERTGRTVTEVVVGRPVHFNEDHALDDVAFERLQGAVADADLPSVSYRLEPVAAAYTYERTLKAERKVLVGDFGGGTADFAILRVGPERLGRADRSDDVLATSGVALAGDALDGRFMDTFLMPFFGRGARYHDLYDTEWKPWSHAVQRQIQRLYYIHLLRDPDLERRLEHVRPRMDDTAVIDRILRLVFDDLGYPMAWAIEGAKKALSEHGRAPFEFTDFFSPRLDIHTEVDVAGYAEGSREILAAYDAALDEVFARAGLAEEAVDDVFLTGGTSHLPFVRGVFRERFGEGRMRSGRAMTSVCEGLALA